jgi:hypothetical protein
VISGACGATDSLGAHFLSAEIRAGFPENPGLFLKCPVEKWPADFSVRRHMMPPELN